MDAVARIAQLQELLQNEPNDLFLNYALGMEYVVSKDTIVLAESQFKKVLQLDKEYIAVYYQLGKLKEMQEQQAEALEFYKKGLELARIQKNNKAINEFGEAVFMLEE